MESYQLPKGSEFQLFGTLCIILEPITLSGVAELIVDWPVGETRHTFRAELGDSDPLNNLMEDKKSEGSGAKDVSMGVYSSLKHIIVQDMIIKTHKKSRVSW